MTDFTRGFLSILSGKVGLKILGIVITPILVRVIGSGGYGDYAFILSIYGILNIFVGMGLFDGVRKFIGEARDDITLVSELATASYILGITISIVFSGLLLVLFETNLVKDVLGKEMTSYFLILIPLFIVNQLSGLSRGVLFGLSLEHKFEPLRILRKFIFGITGITLAYLGYGVTGVLIGFFLSITVQALLSFKMVLFRVNLSAFSGLKKHAKKLFGFGFQSLILILLLKTLYRVDIIMVRNFLTSVETGYYKAALTTSEFTWFVPMALEFALLQSASNMWANQGLSRISKFTSKLVKYVIILSIPFIVGIFVLAGPFLGTYFGSEFTGSKNALRILLPGVLGYSVARILFPVLQAKGKLKLLIKLTAVVSLINAGLNYLFIPIIGMNGAAIATSISYGSIIIFYGLAAFKIGFNPFKKIKFFLTTINGLLTLLIAYLISSIIPGDILKLIIIPPITTIIYFSSVLRLKILKIGEIREIIENLPSPIKKKSISILNKIMPILKIISG